VGILERAACCVDGRRITRLSGRQTLARAGGRGRSPCVSVSFSALPFYFYFSFSFSFLSLPFYFIYSAFSAFSPLPVLILLLLSAPSSTAPSSSNSNSSSSSYSAPSLFDTRLEQQQDGPANATQNQNTTTAPHLKSTQTVERARTHLVEIRRKKTREAGPPPDVHLPPAGAGEEGCAWWG